MDHISSHIAKTARKKDKATERGELMQYFMDKLNAARVRDGLGKLTMSRMGRLLMAIPTKDLYYLRSVCDNAGDFSKKFWWEINPKNHTPEAKAAAQKAWELKNKAKTKNNIY
ncbi:MAG TPA: hypothetical protein VIJ88_01365 [Candidatus Paceibacterota bacterium]